MSTFSGFLEDPSLNFVAIDRFTEETRHCKAFFLSHVHSDHTHGLFDYKFATLINNTDAKLYCSPLSLQLLRKSRHFHIFWNIDNIITMDVNETRQIKYDTNLNAVFHVTCIDALHCPGSVMFLFQYFPIDRYWKDPTCIRRILYTGDFRFDVDNLKQLLYNLRKPDGTMAAIDDLHLDTTFAFRSLLDEFPVRERSEALILFLVDCIREHAKKPWKIRIELPYRYGLEPVLMKLVEKYKMAIAFHNEDLSDQLDDVQKHAVSFEQAPTDAWIIHACSRRASVFPCSLQRRVTSIKPCALSFLQTWNGNSLKHDPRYNVSFHRVDDDNVKVFYSIHASLKELEDFVQFLKPRRIFPNVRGADE